MIRKLVFWLILVPLAVVLLMFAVANREVVTVSFDPFNTTAPAAAISIPLFVLIFVLVVLGIVIGGIAAWLRQSGYRRAARRRDADVTALRREIDTLNAKFAETPDPRMPAETARLAWRPPSGG